MPELQPFWRNPNYPEFGTTGIDGHALLLLTIEPYNRTRYGFRSNLGPEDKIQLMEQLSSAVTQALVSNLPLGHVMQAWSAQLADEYQLRTLPIEARPLAQELNEILNTYRQRPKPPLFEI